MFCRNCGAQLRDDDVFCSKCGTPVSNGDKTGDIMPDTEDTVLDLSEITAEQKAEEAMPKAEKPAEKKKSKKPLIITLSIVGVIVLALCAFAAYKFISGYHLSAGDKYFDEGRYEEAADAYDEVLEQDPENTKVRINLAKAYMELREYDDVIETLDYLIRYDDGDSEVFEMLITACGKEREFDLANDYYQEAADRNIGVDLKDTGFAEVPDLVGLDLNSTDKFDDIQVSIRERVDNDAKEDTILSQYPQAGVISYMENGVAQVYVNVSNGPGETLMKDYSGKTLDEIKSELGDTYKYDSEEESSSSIPAGQVIRTVPAAGEPLKKGAEITVYISTGEKIVSVPKIVGKTYDQAEDLLDNVDLDIGKVTYESSSKQEGTIITQNPAYKEKVNADTKVDVVVSSGQ